MSHFSTVKTRIHEEVLLEEALADLDYAVEKGEQTLINDEGDERVTVQMAVDVGAGDEYKVGFRKLPDGTYDICADWWRIEQKTGLNQQRFLNNLNARYAYAALKRQAAAQGYIIESEKINANGEIELVVTEPI